MAPPPIQSAFQDAPFDDVWLRFPYFVTYKQKANSGDETTLVGAAALKAALTDLFASSHIQLSHLEKFHVSSGSSTRPMSPPSRSTPRKS